MSRLKLPERHNHWIQKAKIGGQTFYLTVGEYLDGKPGGITLDASKQGTFVRGIMDSLARNISLSLQNGTPLEEVIKVNQCLNYPPNGEVLGSPNCKQCTSIADWVAQELYTVYFSGSIKVSEVQQEEKSAGYISESWRLGV